MTDLVSGSLATKDKDKSLSLLHKTTMGLLDRLPVMPVFESLPKNSNVYQRITELAAHGAEREVGLVFVDYSPNMKTVLQVVASNVKVFCTSDLGTTNSPNTHFIDAAFLVTLAGYENALRGSLDKCPSIQYIGKGVGKASKIKFDVIGVLNIPLRVKIQCVGKTSIMLFDRVVVLYQFCVPLHLSVKERAVEEQLELFKWTPVIFGKNYKHHLWYKGQSL